MECFLLLLLLLKFKLNFFFFNFAEDTTIFDLINDQIECNRNVDNNNCLDLATIIGECYQQKTENPKFDITRLECFQERREQINELRRQTQQLQQRNLIETCKLRKNSMDYLKFLHFLKKVFLFLIAIYKQQRI